MSDLLRMQAPKGLPRSPYFEMVSDPLIPPKQTSEMLAHFHEAVYDLRPESHLSRLLKVLLGDTGTGQLRKRYTYAHLSQFLATMRYHDLDRFFAGIFGLKRFLREAIEQDIYHATHTEDEWEQIDVADASYRSRLAAFTGALAMAGTPSGMAIAASAVLGTECRVYETYEFIDSGEEPPFESRLPAGGRSEFVIRPMREITSEERVHLVRVLDRIKPAQAMLTIDDTFADAFIPVSVARTDASSSYWRIEHRVLVDPQNAGNYLRYIPQVPVTQPRLMASHYQGEAWNYNGAATVTSYAEDESGQVVQSVNFNRHVDEQGRATDFTPDMALTSPEQILRGRMVSDGVISAPVATRGAV